MNAIIEKTKKEIIDFIVICTNEFAEYMEIEKIELVKCKPYKDFGQGFYTTSLQEQALEISFEIFRKDRRLG